MCLLLKVTIVYATYCEIIKYDANDDTLKNFGLSPEKWSLFLYNNNEDPSIAYGGFLSF